MDNAGAVVRVGDTVRRPARGSSPAVRALLLHLEDVGFEGAPRYLGSDEHDREVFSYVEGEAPLPPFPAWSMTQDALRAVASLLRRFHEAVDSFDPLGVSGWAPMLADPAGGSLVCHNDPYPENVIFREGRPVALIDFDLAAPGRPLWDVARAARVWAPLGAPQVRDTAQRRLDGVTRLGRFAAAYGVDSAHAGELVDLIWAERAQMLTHIRGEIAQGNPTWVDYWHDTQGEERAAADDAWLDQHRCALEASLCG